LRAGRKYLPTIAETTFYTVLAARHRTSVYTPMCPAANPPLFG
jgi:hypothetical protein